MKPLVSILVPVKNEEESLPVLFAELDKALQPLVANHQFHLLVLDDGSSDRTAEITKQHSSEFFSIGLCSFTRNFGKESAITAGLEQCESDAYIIMDGDLQHPPSLIAEMILHWEQGFKVVEGVKRDRGDEAFLYRLFSKLFYKSLSSLSSLNLENLSDYKLLDREVVNAMRRLPERDRFFRGLIDWMGYRKYQISFDVPKRQFGTTSWSTWQLIRFSFKAISSFSSTPLYLITIIGGVMLLSSLVLGSWTLYQWATGQAVTGFTTVILLLLLIGSMLMVSLGLIGIYLSKIYTELKGRPVYMIREQYQTSASQEKTDSAKR